MEVKPGRSWRRALLVALLLADFTLVLEVGPAFHHDFDCHLKSPTHCPACLASPAALGQDPAPALGTVSLLAAEAVRHTGTSSSELPLVASLKDRSPPA